MPPTLLHLAGLERALPRFDGQSLAFALHGEPLVERQLLASNLLSGRDQQALLTQNWKLIETGQGDGAPTYLFDRTKPRSDCERVDVSAEHPDALVSLSRLLRKLEDEAATATGGKCPHR